MLTNQHLLDTIIFFVQFFLQTIFYLLVGYNFLLEGFDNLRIYSVAISQSDLTKPNCVMDRINKRVQSNFSNPIPIQIDHGESGVMVRNKVGKFLDTSVTDFIFSQVQLLNLLFMLHILEQLMQMVVIKIFIH